MLLHLVRHAESVANALAFGQPPDFAGAPIDCTLTPLGERQAAAVGDHLARLGIDVVLSSPYLRTLQTAEAIRQRCQVPGRIVPLLHEHHLIGFPDVWPLTPREHLRLRFPGFTVDDDWVDRDWFRPPETEDQALARAGRIIAWLREHYGGHPGIRIAVVSHGSPVSKMVQAFIDVPTSENVRIGVDNASHTTLELRDGMRWIHAVNRVDHLAEPGVPGSTQNAETGAERPST